MSSVGKLVGELQKLGVTLEKHEGDDGEHHHGWWSMEYGLPQQINPRML